MDKVLVFLTVLALAFGLVLGVSLLFALPVMLCWNYVMPTLGVHEISFSQAWALMILSALLVKGGTASASKA